LGVVNWRKFAPKKVTGQRAVVQGAAQNKFGQFSLKNLKNHRSESRGSRGCPKLFWAVFDFYEEPAVRVLKNKLEWFRSRLAPNQKGAWIPCPVSPSPQKNQKAKILILVPILKIRPGSR